jgi:hypothetical protein
MSLVFGNGKGQAHVGGSFRYQQPNDATAANDDRVLQPGSTLRTEANILGENLLGTQPLTSPPQLQPNSSERAASKAS